jgi:hypothetical protein
MTHVIGQLKAKSTAYCTICSCTNKRTITVNIYENSPEEIEKGKAEIKARAAKKYTCRICTSIIKSLND